MSTVLRGVAEPALPPTVAGDRRRKHRAAAAAADAVLRLYQAARLGRPSPCRYWPSCSQYAREAIDAHGLGRGLRLTAGRLLRCRPLGPQGFDPVPPPRRGQAAE